MLGLASRTLGADLLKCVLQCMQCPVPLSTHRRRSPKMSSERINRYNRSPVYSAVATLARAAMPRARASAKHAKESKEQLYFPQTPSRPFLEALKLKISPIALPTRDVPRSPPRGYILFILHRSFPYVLPLLSNDAYLSPSPSFPCQQRSMLIDAQASGPTLAFNPSREDGPSLYLNTRRLASTAKTTPLRRAAGAEQAIWKVTKKPR